MEIPGEKLNGWKLPTDKVVYCYYSSNALQYMCKIIRACLPTTIKYTQGPVEEIFSGIVQESDFKRFKRAYIHTYEMLKRFISI